LESSHDRKKLFPEEFKDVACINEDPNALITTDKLITIPLQSPVFICVISYTATCEIPGITIAGANPDLIKYTPSADAEFLYYGHCKCIDKFPITADGKPTPAIITRAALKLTNIPFFVVDAGSKIKPSVPHVSFNIRQGKNIRFGKGVDIKDVKKAFEYGVIFGKELAKVNDMVIIGESIPGGTTTALGVLTALGIDAKLKISSSTPKNPHNLKNEIVLEGMKNANISFGQLLHDPFSAISLLGDPMIPSVAGIVDGIINSDISNRHVMLAGGTQMSSVIATLNSLGRSLDRVYIGTTIYVTKDRSSSLADLVKAVSPKVRVYESNLHMAESSYPGLQAFAQGFVKEGVGAGGISIIAMMKSGGQIDGKALLKAIEEEYNKIISR
jgi:uncharacterized protein (TIGR00303 family)